MSSLPNRVLQLRDAIERGEQVDLNKLATLQAMDLVIYGREMVEEAVREQRDADEQLAKLLADASRATVPDIH